MGVSSHNFARGGFSISFPEVFRLEIARALTRRITSLSCSVPLVLSVSLSFSLPIIASTARNARRESVREIGLFGRDRSRWSISTTTTTWIDLDTHGVYHPRRKSHFHTRALAREESEGCPLSFSPGRSSFSSSSSSSSSYSSTSSSSSSSSFATFATRVGTSSALTIARRRRDLPRIAPIPLFPGFPTHGGRCVFIRAVVHGGPGGP